MIKIDNLKLTDIAAKSTLTDDTTKWIYQSIDYAIQKKHDKLKTSFDILDRIHYLSEKEIELLLWEYHVEGFDETTSIEEKRILILESLLTHMKKGTVHAVKKNLDLLFGSSEIQEWFEYNGTPGKFRVKTKADTQNNDIYKKILNIIESIKNTRSHLENVEFVRENKVNIYTGVNAITNNYYKIEIGG